MVNIDVRNIRCETIDRVFDCLSPTNPIWKNAGFGQMAFRGQADADWPLIPRAFRKDEILGYSGSPIKAPLKNIGDQSKAEYLAVLPFVEHADSVGLEIPGNLFEFRSLQNLNPVSAVDFWNKKWPQPSQLELLAIAQHHGVPTRLLDFSYRGTTALYFAAVGALGRSRKKNPPKEFAVWAIDLRFVRKIWGINPTSRDRIREIVIPRSGNPFLLAQDGLFLMDSSAPEHWDVRESADSMELNSVIQARTAYWSNRPGQWLSGSPMTEHVLPYVKISVPLGLAKNILRTLHRQGVNHASLMPSHDHVVESLEFMRKFKFPTA